MTIGPKIEKHFCHFIVRMLRPKSLNISRSPYTRALILVPKHFCIWGINAIKIFSELVGGGGGLKLSQFFTFLKF